MNKHLEGLEQPKEAQTQDQEQKQTPPAIDADLSAKVSKLLETQQKTLKIADIASHLGLTPEEITLPNGRIVKQITWTPAHLPEVFATVNKFRIENSLGKNDTAVIDGVCPTWLLPAISHAFHPVSTAVSYPQGGPNAVLPINGAPIEGAGSAENVEFKVEENEDFTLVEFSLSAPQIDIEKTLATFVAPAIATGKPVRITGRGPIALATSLAEAYAHKVPYIANFQPGTGFVISISHDANNPLGTVLG